VGDTEHQRPRLGPAAPDPDQTGLLRPEFVNQVDP